MRFYYYRREGDNLPSHVWTYRKFIMRSMLPQHAMSDPPFDQEDDQVERAYCSVRMNDGRAGFKWSYRGEGCLERAQDMAKWARENPDEWVQIKLQDGCVKWYSLRQVSTIEVWHDPVFVGEDPSECPPGPVDIEGEIEKLRNDIEKAEKEGIG